MKRRICSVFLLIVLISTLAISVAATSGIMPRLNNTSGTSTNFTITSAGKATVTATYDAYRSLFTNATITSYIEKRTLGLFWTKVNIDQPNNEWVDTSTDYIDAFVHEIYLDSKGTYRATVIYEISGTGGATDVIDYEQERTYS